MNYQELKELIDKDLERFDRDLCKQADAITAINRTLKGGNGDSEGLCEKTRKNTEFRVEMQDLIRKLNYRIWALIATAIVVLLRDVISQVLLK